MQFSLMDKSLTLMLDHLSCLFEQFFSRYIQLKPSISYDPVFFHNWPTFHENRPNFVLSVYSPFSDRVGLPLYNIISPFLPVMNICRSQVLPWPLLHSPTMSFLVVKPVFGLQLYTHYISSPSPPSHVHTISAYHF